MPGCSHRPLFYALKKLGLFVFGDIGCYGLAVSPPLSAMHASTCMGAGIGGAYGAGKVLGSEGLGKICAVLGDSTFLHSGIGPLMDAVYNGGYSTTIILDNRITAMTGQQEHPGTGFTIKGDPADTVDYEQLARAVGVKHVRMVDPYNIKETMEVIREEVNRDEASVIITKNSPCMLLRRAKPRERFQHPSYRIDNDTCTGCRLCLNINCPAISWLPNAGTPKSGRKRKGTSFINQDQCVGCGVCIQICEFESIVPQCGMRRRAMSNNGKTRNIFLSGVGGQGTILASNILGQVLLNAGYDVKKAEVHGMAQRGGDVTTHFRFGEKVYSPLIKQGDVDYLVSFELLEALRYINWVKPDGKVILNNHSDPSSLRQPRQNGISARMWNRPSGNTSRKTSGWSMGAKSPRTLGNIQVANVVLIGALSNFFPELNAGTMDRCDQGAASGQAARDQHQSLSMKAADAAIERCTYAEQNR